MNLEDIKQLVAKDESETLEFKKSTSKLKEAAQTICAFANTKGGTVLIGVTPDLQIVGQEITDGTQQKIAAIRQLFEPAIPLDIEFITADNGNKVIAIHVCCTELNPPYSFDGRPYKRVNNTTQRMPAASYNELVTKQIFRTKKWEAFAAEGYTVDDLDNEEILLAVQDGIAHKRIPPSYKITDITVILDKFNLLSNGFITNAAVVLFGKDTADRHSQCLIRLARFRGIDKKEFMDNQQVHGNAFKILQAVDDFCMRHLPVAGHIIPGKMARKDEPFIPIIAIREAVINAICHRDYYQTGGSIYFAIYDDRLEISSAGELSSEINIKSLLKEHKSDLRNPKISEVFYKRGMIEQWGRGTNLIMDTCLQNGHHEPEFIERSSYFYVIMRSKYTMSSSTRQEFYSNLSKRQQEIIALLDSYKNGISAKDIQSKISSSISIATIKRDLGILKESNLLQTKGSGKNIVWVISDGSDAK